ncbi:MAG: hypothetical protein ACE5J9_07685 [Methanosarcinales archaeon]
MLIDASSYKNLKIIGLETNNFETVAQVAEEIGMDVCDCKIIPEVTKDDMDTLLDYLKNIAMQTDMIISVELEKSDVISNVIVFNPKSKKGGKISLHYGEVYLLAKVVNNPDLIICDDESVIYAVSIINGICGTDLKIQRTIKYLYSLYSSKTISAKDFREYLEKMMCNNILYFRCPPKDRKDKVVLNVILEFMDGLILDLMQTSNLQHTI